MKNVPKLRFKGFCNEWEEYKVGEIFDKIKNPVDVKKNEKYQQIGIRSHGKGIFYKDLVTGEELGNKRVFWVEPDVFIVNIVFAWERAVARTTKNEVGMIASHRFPMYKPKEDILNLDFITYLFKTKKGQCLLEMASPGGAGRNKTLGQKEFDNLSVKLPSLQEQQRIEDFLTKVDKLIEKQNEKVNNLEDYKKGMMQKIFSQEIRFKGDNREEYPEWEENKLKNICEIIMGQSPNSEYYNEKKEGLPLIQGNADIKDRKTNPRIYTTSITKCCEKGDIIMSVRAPVGIVSKAIHKACIGRGVCSIRSKANKEFIFQLLLFMEEKWGRISQGSTFESISRNDICSLMVKIPCLEEQSKIANFLSKIDNIIEKEKEKLEELRKWKKGLLQQMFV